MSPDYIHTLKATHFCPKSMAGILLTRNLLKRLTWRLKKKYQHFLNRAAPP